MDPQELGRQVFKRRKDLGISQDRLAKQAGISRNYVSLIERGEAANVSMIIVGQLADALGTSAAELTGEIERPDIVIPGSLRDFGLTAELNFSTIVKLLEIPRRGRQPQTVEEWRKLYDAVRFYLDDEED